MKVLAVNAGLDPVSGGGTAERTFQMTRALALAGADCTALTLDIGLTAERLTGLHPGKSVALRCINTRFLLFPLPEPRISSLVAWADVVHLMGHWTLLNIMVARECLRQHKPYVVCPAGALPIFGRSGLLKCIYNLIAGRRLIARASAHVAIAHNELEQFADYGIAKSAVQLIPNGIDPDEFSAVDDGKLLRDFNLPPKPFILFLGRLALIKGPDLLLKAFATFSRTRPDVHLVYAGPDGGMLNELRALAVQSGASERIHFIGPVRGQDKSRICHAAELLVVPSRQEAMSIVVLEAGICGTPVLLTDRCGFDQVAGSGGGRVVAATADALQIALLELFAEQERLPVMGKLLREFIRKDYLWPSVATKYLELFRQVVTPGLRQEADRPPMD